MGNEIILSICIPTYNRAKYLEDTILSIVNQKTFRETRKVEIIIGDNCSDDNTGKVAQKYIDLYRDKISYYRNSENLIDLNFEKVLSKGKGLFLKLNNDTLVHFDNSLDEMIDGINQNVAEKNIIFHSNGILKNITKIYNRDLDSFVKTVSFYGTWIACFGIWKEDFDTLEGFNRNAKLHLVQLDVLLRLVSAKRIVLVDNTRLFKSVSALKGGYNIYKIFVTNYLGLLEEYQRRQELSYVTIFNEKSRLLKKFLIPWYLNITKKNEHFNFEKKGALLIVFQKYRFHPLFYLGICYLFFRLLLIKLKSAFGLYKTPA